MKHLYDFLDLLSGFGRDLEPSVQGVNRLIAEPLGWK